MNANRWLTYLIASVWLVNGLFCKVLNLVPRHQKIVEQILGNNYPRTMTMLIGFAEVVMAVWIVSGWRPRQCSIIQILVVGIMNVLEFFLTPDLLFWGKANSVFALLFISLIYLNEFHFKQQH